MCNCTGLIRENKMSKNWNLTGGVIITGSLLWEDHLNNRVNRKNWRNYHLDKKSKIMVKLPIRYGRYSDKGIYTMVFSNNCQRYKKLGTGYIFPFKSNPINNFRQLVLKSIAMSRAEGMHGKFCGVTSNGEIWGKMGILFNNSKIDKKTKENILSGWGAKISAPSIGLPPCDFKFLKNEKACITNKGELDIKWVEPVEKRDSQKVSRFDFLIAAATKPEHNTINTKRYPNVQEIAISVNNDTQRFYFINNVKAGITTFQDNAILNEL